jgi:hypothetical protein
LKETGIQWVRVEADIVDHRIILRQRSSGARPPVTDLHGQIAGEIPAAAKHLVPVADSHLLQQLLINSGPSRRLESAAFGAIFGSDLWIKLWCQFIKQPPGVWLREVGVIVVFFRAAD